MDTIGKIKRLLEDLQYRTEEKSPEEIYHLALTLFELAAEHRFSNTANQQAQSIPEPTVAPSIEPAEPAESRESEESVESAQTEPAEVAARPAEGGPAKATAESEQPEAAEVAPAPAEPAEVAARLEKPETVKQDNPINQPAKSIQPSKMKIGFNDRFAFINKLFHGDAEEYGNIIAAIEGMSDFHQAENYINMVVKPDFDWSEAEEYEERFMACIEQHFA